MAATTKKAIKRLATRTAAVTTALCLVTGAAGAYAYWAATGAGAGSATTGTVKALSAEALVVSDATGSTLVPGGTADVALRAFNPNPFPVQVYAIGGNGAATADAAHPACLTTGVTFVAPAAPLAPVGNVPANSSVLSTLHRAAAMSAASQSGCQGATFSLPVTLEARK